MPNGSQYQSVDTGYGGPWVDQLLSAIGAPTSDSNRAAIRAWAASEGTVNSNNPLAFSGTYPGATTCIAQCGSSSPIMAYNSANQGATNTAAFLEGNSSYQGILAALRTDAGIGAIFNAINGSPWCKGCQNGTYPTALHSLATGGSGGGGVPSGSATAGGTTAGTAGWNPNAPAFGLPIIGTILNAGQELKIKGWALMISGGLVAFVGLGLLVSALGLESKAARAVSGAVPGPVGAAARAVSGSGSPRSGERRERTEETAGRRESREIERRYRETERQQGPIGPRGGSETSQRVAQRRRQPSPTERRRLMQPTGPRGRNIATPPDDDF